MKYKLKDIPFQQILKLGLKREDLERNGNLEKLLNGEKTEVFSLINPANESKDELFAHLKLKETPKGDLSFEIIRAEYIPARKEKISIEKIPFEQIEKYGISKNTLQADKNLEKLLNGEKTNPIHVKAYFQGKYISSPAIIYLIEKDNVLKFKFDFNLTN